MLLGPGLRRALTSVHLDKERQAAGAAAGHDGGHGWPTQPAEQAGSRLEITDDPRPGTTQDFTFTATLNAGRPSAR